MAFHAKDGWLFQRNDDGSVTITSPFSWCTACSAISTNGQPPPCTCHPERHAKPREVRLDAAMWASIIASVSSEGEQNYRFDLARKFHNGGMKRCAHPLGAGFVGAGGVCGLYLDVHEMINNDHTFTA